MTPDLMEEGARRLQKTLAPAVLGQTESGGRAAGFSRVAVPGEVDVTHGRILYLEDVHVSFDGFKAINGLNLDIAPGELRCIIGPNGAGKTTLLSALMGLLPSDGDIVYMGQLQKHERSVEHLVRHGMTLVPEKRELFGEMTVEDNLLLGGFSRWRRGQRDHLRRRQPHKLCRSQTDNLISL